MFLVSSCSCLGPIQGSQVLSREQKCSLRSADRRCSNYIWVIDNFIAYLGAAYIRDLTVMLSNAECKLCERGSTKYYKKITNILDYNKLNIKFVLSLRIRCSHFCESQLTLVECCGKCLCTDVCILVCASVGNSTWGNLKDIDAPY